MNTLTVAGEEEGGGYNGGDGAGLEGCGPTATFLRRKGVGQK